MSSQPFSERLAASRARVAAQRRTVKPPGFIVMDPAGLVHELPLFESDFRPTRSMDLVEALYTAYCRGATPEQVGALAMMCIELSDPVLVWGCDDRDR